jgi:hypothetical protein
VLQVINARVSLVRGWAYQPILARPRKGEIGARESAMIACRRDFNAIHDIDARGCTVVGGRWNMGSLGLTFFGVRAI